MILISNILVLALLLSAISLYALWSKEESQSDALIDFLETRKPQCKDKQI